MDISILRKENFYRDETGFENILDDYWTIEVKEIARTDERLAAYFEDPAFSDISISIAGKSDGIDQDAFRVALEVLPNLHVYLNKIATEVGLKEDKGWWTLCSIWFPYQQVSIWYLHFMSDYGSDFEVSFARDGLETEFRDSGWRKQESIAHVPFVVKYVLEELKQKNVRSRDFAQVLKAVDDRKTMGLELINPLIEIVSNERELVRENTRKHMLKRLSAIRCNAIAN